MFLDKKLLELCIYDNGVPFSQLQNVQNAGLSYPMAINAHRKTPKAARPRIHSYEKKKWRAQTGLTEKSHHLRTSLSQSFPAPFRWPGTSMRKGTNGQGTPPDHMSRRAMEATITFAQKGRKLCNTHPATVLVDRTHFTITKACNVDRFSSFYKQENQSSGQWEI